MAHPMENPIQLTNLGEIDTYLKTIYYDVDNSAGFSGVKSIHEYIKKEGKFLVKLKDIKLWLSNQPVYSIFKQPRRKFHRARVIVSEHDRQWDCDCLHMDFQKKYNSGYGYILVCIDIFTRYLFTRPLYALTGENLKEAFTDIFKYNEAPATIRTDSGSEFKNFIMKQFFQQNNIHHFVTSNEVKSNYAERVIRTLRMRIARLFKYSHSFVWLNSLHQITSAYNNSIHRILKTSPQIAMCNLSRSKLWHDQYFKNDIATKTGSSMKFVYNINDRVRISYIPSMFHRAYDEHWSTEIFTIINRKMNQGYDQYQIKASDNSSITGWFYSMELQMVKVDQNQTYEIETILKRRRRNNKTEVLV